MNVLLVHCMIMVIIGLAFALMAFFLFRVALLTSPTEKPGRNLLRALPGILFSGTISYPDPMADSQFEARRRRIPPMDVERTP